MLYVITKSRWNKCDISCKSLAVLVKNSPKVLRKERALELNPSWDAMAMVWKIYKLVLV